MLRRSESPLPEDAVTPEEEIKDPFVLEFLGLKDEYSESDLEEALIRQLENFLLELGGDFAFVGRQRRLRIGDQWFRVDLLFFYRGLHRLVIIDLLCGGQHNSSMTTRQRRPRWKNSRSTRNHWFPMRRCRCLPTKAKSPPSSSRKLSNFLIRASSK